MDKMSRKRMALSHEHKRSELDTGWSMEICTTCARFDGFGLVAVWHGSGEYKGSVSVHASELKKDEVGLRRAIE